MQVNSNQSTQWPQAFDALRSARIRSRRSERRPGRNRLSISDRCRCVGLLTVGELCRLNLGDHVDFDASAKWHLRHTDGATRMDASLTEYLDKELRRPIRNSVRLRDVRCTVDHDKGLYDSSNAVKIADGGFKHGQQFNCHVARGELALLQANLPAYLSTKGLTILLAKAAGEMNLVT